MWNCVPLTYADEVEPLDNGMSPGFAWWRNGTPIHNTNQTGGSENAVSISGEVGQSVDVGTDLDAPEDQPKGYVSL
jgi:hypothetical protein